MAPGKSGKQKRHAPETPAPTKNKKTTPSRSSTGGSSRRTLQYEDEGGRGSSSDELPLARAAGRDEDEIEQVRGDLLQAATESDNDAQLDVTVLDDTLSDIAELRRQEAELQKRRKAAENHLRDRHSKARRKAAGNHPP